MEKRTSFIAPDIKGFEPEAKVGIIATRNPQGEPHLTLITSIRAKSAKQLTWGQFSEGQSKKNLRQNPNTGFLVLTMDRKLWRGKAKWTHTADRGEDFELYNNLPMFRYNAYFGIHTVHYMDLKETYGRESLPYANIVAALAATMAAKKFARSRGRRQVMKAWAESFFNNPTNLKFLSWVDADGFPAIIPCLQCQAADSTRLVFSHLAYARELSQVPPGARVAFYALSLKMESLLVRGTYWGASRFGPATLGVVDIEWVYNSMPPAPGQVYPPVPLEPVYG